MKGNKSFPTAPGMNSSTLSTDATTSCDCATLSRSLGGSSQVGGKRWETPVAQGPAAGRNALVGALALTLLVVGWSPVLVAQDQAEPASKPEESANAGAVESKPSDPAS